MAPGTAGPPFPEPLSPRAERAQWAAETDLWRPGGRHGRTDPV